MPTYTINGAAILRARFYEPRAGLWHADIEADADEDITDAVTIEIEDQVVTYSGSVYRGSLEEGRWIGRVVGGAGGLKTRLGPKFYRAATFGTVIADIMLATGETLSSSSSTAVTAHQRARWQRMEGKASAALWRILDILNAADSDPGYVWRLGRDGEVLITSDSYPELEFAHETMKRDPALGTVTVAPLAAPLLRPGVTFDGNQIDYVQTDLTSGSIRQMYWVA